MSDKGWMSEDRFSDVYRKGVDSFIRFAYRNRIRNSPFCPCPCRVCRNKKSLSFALVKHDLLVNSIDQTYLVWSLHGEKTTRTSHAEENADDGNVLKETLVEEQVEDNFREKLCELAKGKIYATCEGDSEKNPENMAKNLVNSQSKKRSIVPHTPGRCTSHNNKKYKVDQVTGKTVPPSTTEKLLYGHLRSDGTVHPSAAEAHMQKKVTEALERKKRKGVQPKPSNLISDELDEVFGRNKNGGIRGYSSHMSKAQVQMAAIGYSALQQKDSDSQTLNKIEADLRRISGTLTVIERNLVSTLDIANEILTCLKRKAPTSASRLGNF